MLPPDWRRLFSHRDVCGIGPVMEWMTWFVALAQSWNEWHGLCCIASSTCLRSWSCTELETILKVFPFTMTFCHNFPITRPIMSREFPENNREMSESFFQDSFRRASGNSRNMFLMFLPFTVGSTASLVLGSASDYWSWGREFDP